MKSFQLLTLFALIAASLAFAPNQAPQQVAKAAFTKAAGALPVAALAAPAFALDSIVEALPTNTVALEVQYGAYLAVALGTLLPCLFLINLFIQTESRKAGRAGGQDAE
uniref:Photosystem II reaction center M protein n=2 Tax=Phaeodactylum tricornutum TaxID=2850 RepID=Q84XB8_PHATR|nr:photosystem II reaction center M protein precursor [Phaeodactylum tricornutum]